MKGIWFLLVLNILYGEGLENAKDYSQHSHLQWQWALRALESIEWSHQERVLDLGSGDGKITAYIATHYTNAEVIGLDISANMLSHSAALGQTIPNLLFLKGDIAELSFKKEFDLCFAFCSMHYVLEQEKALKGIYESLLPKGRFIFIVPGKEKNYSLVSLTDELVLSPKWRSYFPSYRNNRAYFNQKEYLELFERTGFDVLDFKIYQDKVVFETEEDLKNWLRPLLNYTSHLSLLLREEFLTDLARKMIEKEEIPPDEENVVLTSCLFEVTLEKKEELY